MLPPRSQTGSEAPAGSDWPDRIRDGQRLVVRSRSYSPVMMSSRRSISAGGGVRFANCPLISTDVVEITTFVDMERCASPRWWKPRWPVWIVRRSVCGRAI
jgi:hypothetical protein